MTAIKQVYDILNAVTTEMYGEQAPTIHDLAGMISLGNDVLSSDSTRDDFLNALVDRIGRTVISSRPYTADVQSLLRNSFEYGAILQKIYVSPLKAEKSTTWGLEDGQAVDQYIIKKPDVKTKLFSVRDTWQVKVTIPDIQLRTAFTSETEMAVFIDAIFTAMQNSMQIQLEAMANLAYANLIGERVVDTKLHNKKLAIDLLAMYNAAFTNTLTADQALLDKDFLKFASYTINLTRKKMAKPSTLYNSEGYVRFTSPDNIRVTVLADFASAVDSYLESDTYHNELVALPMYNEIPYWMATGTDGSRDFASTSSVKVKTASGHDVTQSGVVALLSDSEAVGIGYMNRRSKSSYNAEGEYTNFVEKADMGYYNDLSENAVVFTIGALADVK